MITMTNNVDGDKNSFPVDIPNN